MREAPRHPWAGRLLADGSVLLIIAAWYFAAQNMSAYVLPGPVAVAQSLLSFVTEYDRVIDVLTTVARVLISVAIAVLLGSGLALLAFYVPALDHVVRFRIQPALNAIPSLGWALLGIIWFGVTDTAVIFIQVMILIPFGLINVSQGLAELDGELVEMARSFTRSRRAIFAKIILPMLAPFLAAATQMAFGVGMKIALVAELFGADHGLGANLIQAQTVSDAAMVLATCLIIVIIFLCGDRLVLNPLRIYLQR